MHQVPLILRLVLWHIYSIHHPRAMARARHGVLHKKKIEIPLGPGIYPADSSLGPSWHDLIYFLQQKAIFLQVELAFSKSLPTAGFRV